MEECGRKTNEELMYFKESVILRVRYVNRERKRRREKEFMEKKRERKLGKRRREKGN